MCRARALWTFESRDAAAGLAQRAAFIARLRRHRGPALDLDAAKVVFTELVTNVIKHAAGPIRIRLECDSQRVLLRISDRGPGFTYAPRLPDQLSESGRGLFLVSKSSAVVFVECEGSRGTSVVAVLPPKPAIGAQPHPGFNE